MKSFNFQLSRAIITGNELMNIALAGVGSPIKVFVWRVSTLKFANLKAEKTAIKKEINAKYILEELKVSKEYKIIEGKIPKVTISAKESNSLPISEYAFNNRAKKPSKKSNIAASQIK
jgi:hypothetical protein